MALKTSYTWTNDRIGRIALRPAVERFRIHAPLKNTIIDDFVRSMKTRSKGAVVILGAVAIATQSGNEAEEGKERNPGHRHVIRSRETPEDGQKDGAICIQFGMLG